MIADPSGALAGRRVLVTGGAGVIATELLDRLSAAGSEVLSVDRLPLGRAAPRGVEHLVADLAVADLGPIERFRPEHVLHLAATFERSVESPEFWEQNWSDNVIATHRLADLGRRQRIDSFVFASSYLVYDPDRYHSATVPQEAVALAEQSPLRARNLCGAAKLYGEAEVAFIRDTLPAGFRAVFARIFRVYGRGSRDVVSRWVRAALAGEAIEVYHPENRFDYIFSGDVADGLIRLAASDRAAGIVNLGTGRARPVSDVIAAVERATGTRLRATTAAVDEPYEASCADVTRLRDVLGWQPTTTLDDGVDHLVAFERGTLDSRAAQAGARADG